jgi:hypothetical protein
MENEENNFTNIGIDTRMILNRLLTLEPRIRAITPLVLCCQQLDSDSGGMVEIFGQLNEADVPLYACSDTQYR